MQRADRLPGLVRRALRWGMLGAVGCFLGWGLAAMAAPASASAAPSDCPDQVTSSVTHTLDGVVSDLVHLHPGTSTLSCRAPRHAHRTDKALLDTSGAVADGLVRQTTDELSRSPRPVTTQVGRLLDRIVDGVPDLEAPVGRVGIDATPVAVYDCPGASQAPGGVAVSHRRDGVLRESRTAATTDAATGRSVRVGGGHLPAGLPLRGDVLPGDPGSHSVPTGPHGTDDSPGSGNGAGGNGAQACTGAATAAPTTGVVRLVPSNDDELPSNAAGKPRVSPD